MKIPSVFAVSTIFAVLHLPAFAQEPESNFFRDLKAGTTVSNLPKEMPDPSRLSKLFAAEPRVVGWATDAEAEIGRAISRIEAGKVTVKQIRCRTSTCEIVFVVAAKDSEVGKEINTYLGAAAMMLKKELTLGIGGEQENTTAVLAYLHDEGAGLR